MVNTSNYFVFHKNFYKKCTKYLWKLKFHADCLAFVEIHSPLCVFFFNFLNKIYLLTTRLSTSCLSCLLKHFTDVCQFHEFIIKRIEVVEEKKKSFTAMRQKFKWSKKVKCVNCAINCLNIRKVQHQIDIINDIKGDFMIIMTWTNVLEN